MTESSSSPNRVSARRWFAIGGFAVVLIVATYGIWIWINSDPPFSQQQYDEGYLQAFRMNMTGPGYMDYKSEFWSMQQGFDDGISDFNQIYQHPDVGPFSYSRIDRFRDVLSHIESSDLLDPKVKGRIIDQLRLDLSEWETSTELKNGGSPYDAPKSPAVR